MIIIKARDLEAIRSLVAALLTELVDLPFYNAPQNALFVIERFGLENGVRQPIRFAAQLVGRSPTNDLTQSATLQIVNRVKDPWLELNKFLGIFSPLL